MNYYNENLNYDLGGNIMRLKRNRAITPTSYPYPTQMDDLTYTYKNNGYLPEAINDSGEGSFTPQRKHFVDQSSLVEQYVYDESGRLQEDKNKDVLMEYNLLGLPRRVWQSSYAAYDIQYIYDAAGNKLQKRTITDDCDPLPCQSAITKKDYIGNFLYENGELVMIYHPEGVIRPTPPEADNDTEFVYDYFIKDYLGNVRVVLTEENAYYTEKFLSTLEEAHREIEERNFDNVGETAEDLPTGYPVDGSAELNEKIALLSAANGTEIGPSIVMPVRRGDQVSLRTDYFYTEDAPGATYDNLNMLVNEVLLALAASGSGVLRLTEGQLIDLAAGGNQYSTAIGSFFSSSFDTTDVSKPFGYLVWMLYDNDMNLLPAGSGAKRVTDPNELKDLLEENIPVVQDGYLHAYVSNGSASNVSFDNFLITYMRGQTRQINHYYPYGLSIDGLDHSDEYLNKYTSKELQTGEFFSQTSSGLEMFDFGSRFYDPQVGRWFTPDPAEQFSNPYLAMGNNPVMYVDPNGEFIWMVPLIAGVVFGGVNLGIQASNGNIDNFGDGITAFGAGFVAGAVISTGVMYGLGVPILGTVIKGAGIVYGATTVFGVADGIQTGINTGDWTQLGNAGKQFAGNFYLDENKNFFGQTWQGISRFSWELPQTTIGHGYSQVRNAYNGVDRVDFLGGATFSTKENTDNRQGVSIGNFINIDIRSEIEENFQEYVTGNSEKGIPGDPLYMHEYGHTFDSRLFGPLYLFGIGIPSASGAEWTEIRANKFARKYFEDEFDVDWTPFETRYPLSR
ncbi:hypothetical protein G3O08_20175 [Cryomorpha ignava]|uniref:RHS repeat-associated core domain-containing protein n=1 Tax=Cryomorpha ignava TaxID=101383 RepID=A0A7K3WVW0_9FLAO|nr:RHS repeat-associated core domain-containing protein [Cryomorpha ignava]NEN25810.1 hypothetical protein [Cryomorpha ignava]